MGNLSHTTNLHICHVNTNNVLNKLNHISNLVSDCSVDILGVSETWLNDEILSSILLISSFDLVRSDSPSNTRKHGTAIYIKKSIKYIVVPCNVPNVTGVYLLSYGIYVLTVYRPPSNNNSDNSYLVFLPSSLSQIWSNTMLEELAKLGKLDHADAPVN